MSGGGVKVEEDVEGRVEWWRPRARRMVLERRRSFSVGADRSSSGYTSGMSASSSLVLSLPFGVDSPDPLIRATVHTPAPCPTSVRLSTPVFALKTWIRLFARPTTTQSVSTAREVGMAEAGGGSRTGGGDSAVEGNFAWSGTRWERRSVPPFRQLLTREVSEQ